jgi:hypothetical protein
MPLSQILPPGIAGYEASRQLNQQQATGRLSQLSSLLQMQGALQKQEEDKRKIAMEQQFRSELGALGPNPSQEALTQLASKYVGPKELLTSQQSSLDRKNALKMKELEIIQQHNNRMAEIRQRGEDVATTQRLLQQQAQMFQKQMAAFQVANRPEQPPIVIPDPNSPSGFKYGTRAQAIGGPAPAPVASARAAERNEQRAATGDYAELLTDRLNTLLSENPRSATGIFAPVVRATEAVVNSLAPGAIGSQATISAQTKEQLITVLSQLRGGSQGRLSNQDMRRIDTAIGQINSGTSEGMAQGLADTYDLIDTLQGKPARSGKGLTKPIRGLAIPRIGEVRDGYRFKGGDPAKQENWESL